MLLSMGVWPCIIESHFVATSIRQNNSSMFSISAHDLVSIGLLTSLTVSGIGSISWDRHVNEF